MRHSTALYLVPFVLLSALISALPYDLHLQVIPAQYQELIDEQGYILPHTIERRSMNPPAKVGYAAVEENRELSLSPSHPPFLLPGDAGSAAEESRAHISVPDLLAAPTPVTKIRSPNSTDKQPGETSDAVGKEVIRIGDNISIVDKDEEARKKGEKAKHQETEQLTLNTTTVLDAGTLKGDKNETDACEAREEAAWDEGFWVGFKLPWLILIVTMMLIEVFSLR
ncbi:MAG: hypothetical protein Q9218_008044 [Villophora microphyllina]